MSQDARNIIILGEPGLRSVRRPKINMKSGLQTLETNFQKKKNCLSQNFFENIFPLTLQLNS